VNREAFCQLNQSGSLWSAILAISRSISFPIDSVGKNLPRVNGLLYLTMDNEQWTIDNGQLTMDNGQLTMDNWQWTILFPHFLVQSSHFSVCNKCTLKFDLLIQVEEIIIHLFIVYYFYCKRKLFENVSPFSVFSRSGVYWERRE
jgi:hypothetical protein